MTVWVVSRLGDQDCGSSNDGPLGVFQDREDALKLVYSIANKLWAEDQEFPPYDQGWWIVPEWKHPYERERGSDDRWESLDLSESIVLAEFDVVGTSE